MKIYNKIVEKKSLSAFTLVEIMLSVLIFSIVIIWGFKAYSWVLIWKIKLIESTDIQKEAFYFSEKFFEEIKKGWTIDYEEYFNRTVVGTWLIEGHYDESTWFGNFGRDWWNNSDNVETTSYGDDFYYCRSWNLIANKMWTDGCFENNALNTQNWQSNAPQRFWQYALQFIDYNSNFNADLWDEDWLDGIIWDDDDEYLGEGPEAFSWSKVEEIYLISADKKKRTLFRWSVIEDPNKPATVWNCTWTSSNTWTWWCLGTIEFLKLEWKDWWFDHDTWTAPITWQYDWIVDTWLIDSDFSGLDNTNFTNSIIAWSSSISENWEQLFWDNINVSDVKFFAFPNKDLELAWKDSSPSTNIAPYIRIQMTLSPSYIARRWIKWQIPKIKINTTISLTDIYSR